MAYEIGIMLGFMAVMGFFLFLIYSTDEETVFGDIVRYIFTVLVFLILTITLNAAHVIATDNGASTAVKTTLKTGYVASIWIFFIAFAFFTVLLGISIYNRKATMVEEEESE
jgi:Ca2+/Na+ antiporter